MIYILEKLEIELKLRGFTPATLKSYLQFNGQFLQYINKKPENMDVDDIKKYLAYLISERKLKPASVNLAFSALKFYYDAILKKKMFSDLKPPKIEKKIPNALTKEDIKKLIAAAEHEKHRLLIMCMYASGLRVSECVSLKINDLDFAEGMGKVISGKGRKDRHIKLSMKLVGELQKYLASRKEQSLYVFPGLQGHLSVRMAQKIVKQAAKKAALTSNVHCHVLRSSFATHLLEDGVDIRIIQELLGHSSISTTERYTRISTAQLKKVVSPLDRF